MLSRQLVELCEIDRDEPFEDSELKDNNAALERAIDFLEASYLCTRNLKDHW